MIHPDYIKHHNQIKELHGKKDKDYSGKEPLSNFKELGEDKAFLTAMVRLSDKYSRLKNFLNEEEMKVKDETIIDTLHDLSNYALIGCVLYEENRHKV